MQGRGRNLAAGVGQVEAGHVQGWQQGCWQGPVLALEMQLLQWLGLQWLLVYPLLVQG